MLEKVCIDLKRAVRILLRRGEKGEGEKTEESVELLGDCLRGCDHDADKNVDSKGHADVMSSGNEACLRAAGVEAMLVTVAEKMVTLYSCPGTSWKAGLLHGELEYLLEEIAKQERT
jgi:hypothetical protein